jgi:cholesterol transport system auxiliary component
MKKALAVFTLLPIALSGCGGVFDSKIAAPQIYVLRLPASSAPAPALTVGSVLVQRPEAGPGLDSNRIALLRSDRRFDFYSASLWAAPAPDVVESVIVEALRGTKAFSAVFDDAAPFSARYDLRCTMRRFEADYTSGGDAPTVHAALDCTLGRHRDRALVASFTAQGSVRANEDRLSAVVAAFEAATVSAMNELAQTVTSAVAQSESSQSGSAKAEAAPAAQ